MEIISAVKIGKQYYYPNLPSDINLENLMAYGVHEEIKNEFSFGEMILPTVPENMRITFKNGKLKINGETIIIETIRIGENTITVMGWANEEQINNVIRNIEKKVDEANPQLNLRSFKKRVGSKTEAQAKLEQDPKSFYNKKLFNVLSNFSKSMSVSENSNVEINAPAIMIMFDSIPNTSKILNECKQEEVQQELDLSSGSRILSFIYSSPEDLKNGIINIKCDCDFKLLKEILKDLEKI